MKIAVIGGGAAGFFGALSCAAHFPNHEIVIFEKSSKVLSKVLVSGGGRCNVTNKNFDLNRLSNYYPRGAKALKKSFAQFAALDTVKWFEQRGVSLVAEEDGRMFPKSNKSQTIINCLESEALRNNINVHKGFGLFKVTSIGQELFRLDFLNNTSYECNRILIATGGHPQTSSYEWLSDLGFKIQQPVPSLFTFNVPSSSLAALPGVVVKDSLIKIKQTNLQEQGIVLVTHWGFSGPAVLRLSAWGARVLKSLDYKCQLHFNWVGGKKDDTLRQELLQAKLRHPQKLVHNTPLFDLPRRFWEKLCELSGIESTLKWIDFPNKKLNKLIEVLCNDVQEMEGKTTFKEEFVTAGGIDLEEVNMETMQSKIFKGIYFAGEVLDIDGITGGFNFQAAWTTGWIAGKNIGNPIV